VAPASRRSRLAAIRHPDAHTIATACERRLAAIRHVLPPRPHVPSFARATFTDVVARGPGVATAYVVLTIWRPRHHDTELFRGGNAHALFHPEPAKAPSGLTPPRTPLRHLSSRVVEIVIGVPIQTLSNGRFSIAP
jgi:hypothetical protein